MKRSLYIVLLALAIEFILPSLVRAATNDSVIEYRTSLATNEVKIVLLTGYNLNPQVAVYANEKLQFKQKGPDSILTREYIVLGPFDDITEVSVRVELGFTVSKLNRPMFIDIDNPSKNQLSIFQQLSQAVKLWSYPDKQTQAISQLQSLLNQPSISAQFINEIKYLLGHMLLKTKKVRQAGLLFDELINTSDQMPWSLSTDDILLLRAQGKYWQREFEQAVLLHCQHIQQSQNNSTNHRLIMAKNLLAQNLIEQQRSHNQEGFIAEYLKHCQGVIDGLEGRTVADFNQANNQANNQKKHRPIDDAKNILERNLIRVGDWQNSYLSSQIFGQLWNYYTVNNQHVEAEKAARLAVFHHVNATRADVLVSYYWYLGTSLFRQGKIRQAQQIWRQGLVMAKQHSQQPAGASLFNLAYSYRSVGEYDLAQRYFNQTLVIDEGNEGKLEWQKGQSCNKNGVYSAMTIVQLGMLARLSGDLNDALLMQQCAQAVFDNTNEYYALVAKLEIAQIYMAQQKLDAAQSLINNVLTDKRLMQVTQLKGLLLSLQMAITQQDDSRVDILANQIAQSLEYSSLDFELKDIHHNYPKRQIKLFELLISYYAGKRDVQKLEHFGEKAIRLIETIEQQVLNSQAWYDVQYAVLAEYVKGLYLTDSGQNLHKIFSLLDRYYSVSLNVEKKAFQVSSQQLQVDKNAELTKLWQAKLEAERALIAASEEQQLIARQRADAANENYLAYRLENQPATSIAELPQHVLMSLSQIQQQMPITDVFVRYFIDDEISFALILTKEQLQIQALPNRSEIRQQVDDLNQQLLSTDVRSVVMSSPLSQLLPMLKIQSNQYQRLVIVADDTLHRVPFSLLNVASAGRYMPLSSKMAIVRTHSARGFYGSKSVDNEVEKGSMVLFADPEFNHANIPYEENADSEGFDLWLSRQTRLPQTAVEVASIAAMFNNTAQTKVNLALGKAATNQFLMSEFARKASVLHIATHGYYNAKTPNIVGVLTSSSQRNSSYSNGFLGLDELLSLPFHSDLVIISGCETMMGRYYKGSGTKSITRGLLAKGAKSVIGTLWKVADRPTAQFMTVFYRQLKITKGDVAQALKRAKQQFAQRGRYRHPKYWAGFVLTSTHQTTQVSF